MRALTFVVIVGLVVSVGGCDKSATQSEQSDPVVSAPLPYTLENRVSALETQTESLEQRVEDLEASQLISYGFVSGAQNLYVGAGTAAAVYAYISNNASNSVIKIKGGNTLPTTVVLDSFVVGNPYGGTAARIGKLYTSSPYDYLTIDVGTQITGTVTIDRLPGYIPM